MVKAYWKGVENVYKRTEAVQLIGIISHSLISCTENNNVKVITLKGQLYLYLYRLKPVAIYREVLKGELVKYKNSFVSHSFWSRYSFSCSVKTSIIISKSIFLIVVQLPLVLYVNKPERKFH